MKYSYEDHGLTTVLTLSGELVHDQADVFRRACQDRIDTGVEDVVIDLEHLTLIDSAGLEQLLWLLDTMGERRGSVRLVRPDETVRKILELTRLERRFQMFESIESAARSLR